MFTVLGLVDRDDEYGHEFTTVTIEMPVKDWTRARNKGQLGALYGVDVSNHLRREHGLTYAYNPTVEDKARAVKGIKRIKLHYYKPTTVKPVLRLIKCA